MGPASRTGPSDLEGGVHASRRCVQLFSLLQAAKLRRELHRDPAELSGVARHGSRLLFQGLIGALKEGLQVRDQGLQLLNLVLYVGRVP